MRWAESAPGFRVHAEIGLRDQGSGTVSPQESNGKGMRNRHVASFITLFQVLKSYLHQTEIFSAAIRKNGKRFKRQ